MSCGENRTELFSDVPNSVDRSLVSEDPDLSELTELTTIPLANGQPRAEIGVPLNATFRAMAQLLPFQDHALSVGIELERVDLVLLVAPRHAKDLLVRHPDL